MTGGESCELLCIDLPEAERVRHDLPSPPALAEIVAQAGALAEPNRLSILLALRSSEELCGCDLAWILGRSQALISHHLRILRETRLIASRPEARMVFHSLTAEARAVLDTFVGSEVAG